MAARKEKFVRTFQSHGKTEIPQPAICGKCKQLIGRGLRDGMDCKVDYTPLTRMGELASIIQGHKVYYISPPHSYYQRKAWHIENDPNPEGGILFRQHICFRPPVNPDHVRHLPPPKELPEWPDY